MPKKNDTAPETGPETGPEAVPAGPVGNSRQDCVAALATISREPWALRPEAMADLHASLELGAGGLPAPAVAARLKAAVGLDPQASSRSGIVRAGTVAVIPIRGMIRQNRSAMEEFFGIDLGTTTSTLVDRARAAMDDDEVSAVVFACDSPGGSVRGLAEAADALYALRGSKPMLSVVTGEMASAAYHLGCQADEIVISPSAEAGSIGVWQMHVDESRFLESIGYDITLIFAGKFKVEGNPWEPLSEEAQAHFQEQVDEFYGRFVKDVARGRDDKVSAVRNGYGQGRMMLAKSAVEAGLADRVGTLEETIAKLQGARPRRRTGSRSARRLAFI